MSIFMKATGDLYDEHNSSKMRRRALGRTCQNGKTSWSQVGSSRHVSGDSPTRKARAAPYLVNAIILAIINDYRVYAASQHNQLDDYQQLWHLPNEAALLAA